MQELDGWITRNSDISLKSAKKQSYGNIERYQRQELLEAIRYCKSFRTAIDIGAHVGIMSYQLSQQFQQVHAFEVDTEMYDCLNQNLRNRKVDNVQTYDVGIGDKDADVDIIRTNKSFSTHIRPNSKGDYKIKPLDSFNFQNVDFIKIDAEGFEPLIAQGALNTIIKNKPIILYERKDHGQRYGYQNRDDFLKILEPHGYKMLAKLGRGLKNAVIGCFE